MSLSYVSYFIKANNLLLYPRINLEISMLNIAIVEDEEEEKNKLLSFIKKYQEEKKITINCDYFENANKFIYPYKGSYDVVLMDIEMPGINGLDASIELRKRDNNIFIVFVTNMRQFASQGYQVDAVDFIIKPITYYGLSSTIDKILRIKSKRIDKKITLKNNDGLRIINISDIVYIEVKHHKLFIHTQNEIIETWNSLNKIEEEIPSSLFARCNIAYLVNLNYVKGIQGDDVLLPNESLKISRSKKKEFIENLTKFIGALS